MVSINTLSLSAFAANRIPNTHKNININSTSSLLSETKPELSEYMKQKMDLYNVLVSNARINSYDKYKDYSDSVNGVIHYNDKEILIYDFSKSSKTKHILFHELGHALDYYDELDKGTYSEKFKYSSSMDFQKLFKLEGQNIYKYCQEKYFYDKKEESFAESFAIYMDEPEFFQKNAPSLYNYIDTIANQPKKLGWISNNLGDRFYLKDDDTYHIGWLFDIESNNWYYFDDSGMMVRGQQIDGYWLSPSGNMI